MSEAVNPKAYPLADAQVRVHIEDADMHDFLHFRP